MKSILSILSLFALYFNTFGQNQHLFQFYFNLDDATISISDFKQFQDSILSIIDTKKDSIIKIEISGFCDDRGSNEYNKILAQKRVEAVFNVIKRLGILNDVEKVLSPIGELALNSSNIPIEKQRQKNRRVDAVLNTTPYSPPTLDTTSEEQIVEEEIFEEDLEVGDMITLKNIIFIGGRHVVRQSSKPELEKLLTALEQNEKYEVEIRGHICCLRNGRDGEDYDTGKRNLSVARAKAIYDYLVKNGIDPTRLTYVGLKAKYPLGKGDNLDRRVEIKITKIREQ